MKRATGYIVFVGGLFLLVLFAAVFSVHATGVAPTAQLWNTYLPELATKYTASTFTPDAPLTVSRIQVQVSFPSLGCRSNAVLQISDSTAAGTHTLPITGSTVDSGPISISYSAGVPITLSVSTPAQCVLPLSVANVVVQYDTTALQSTITTLQNQLAAAQSQDSALTAQVASLQAQNTSLISQNANLQNQLFSCQPGGD